MSYSYLLFDAADDAILAECESAEDVRAMMERLQTEQPQREVGVPLFAEHRGELVSIRGIVTSRALTEAEGFALYGR